MKKSEYILGTIARAKKGEVIRFENKIIVESMLEHDISIQIGGIEFRPVKDKVWGVMFEAKK